MKCLRTIDHRLKRSNTIKLNNCMIQHQSTKTASENTNSN